MSRTIVAIVDDLFFKSKIRGTAEQVGVAVAFPRSADGLREIISRDLPSLIVCDLQAEKIDPIDVAKTLKGNEQTREVPLLGFFSHVQTELQSAAEQAGFDRVIPRSLFAKSLIQILTGTEGDFSR